MRMLITGGAGCLGSNLVEALLPQGHEILVIDNFTTGRREALPEMPSLSVVEGSIADRALVNDAFENFRPSHVVHGAAAYKDPADWHSDAMTNVVGSINVVEAARRAGVKRFINLQTALCYGRPERVPIPIDHPVRPTTSYAISKTAGESYVAISDLPWASLRLANIAGPRLAIGPIPTFYQRLKTGQSCFCSDTIRDFIDMDDFVRLVERVLEGPASGVYNVSTGEGHSIKEVFDIVVDHLGVRLDRPVPIVSPGAGDVPAVVLDPARTVHELGWQPRNGFEPTIRRVLAWYDVHGVTDIYSHLLASDRMGR